MSFRPLMNALKLFLPSWNFFNDFAAVPRMEYRLVGTTVGPTDWRPLFTNHSTRGLGRILFNPQGNLELLEKSLIDRADDEVRLMTDSEGAAFAESETHAALVRMARFHLMARTECAGAGQFQFRLALGEPGSPPAVVFTSAVLPVVEETP